MDYQTFKEKDKVVDLKNITQCGGRVSLKMVLRMSQVVLPLIVAIGGVIYWIKGLQHYNNACSIN